MSIPDEYLDMTLRNVVALTGKPHRRGEPCEVATITAAVAELDQKLTIEDDARRAEQAGWLAEQFEQLSTTELDDEPSP